jgi:hypothetical protein
MIRNVAVATEAATRIISSFFRHRIPKYSNSPRGLRIPITTSITPSKLQFDTCRYRKQKQAELEQYQRLNLSQAERTLVTFVAENSVDDQQNESHKTNNLQQAGNNV